MAAHAYRCGSDARRRAVAAGTTLNGIDFLEVSDDQRRLLVRFLHPLPGGGAGEVPAGGRPLTAADLEVEGGVRRRGIRVVGAAAEGDLLTVTVDRPGDFSTYRLHVRAGGVRRPPDGFDPQLASVDFSFKAGCPDEFDCETSPAREPAPLPEPEIDYLAKDYASFRRLMLDRLAALRPDRTGRNPADAQVALVELLAFAADRLSYQQDAVATEAHLGTARRRVSVRRHARLLDYRMHDGCNARAFVHLRVAQDWSLPEGAAFLAGPAGRQPLTFMPMHRPALRVAHDEIAFHTWSEEECCLPAGATRATLASGDPPVRLVPGDLLLLEETANPATGEPTGADPAHRQVVRLTHAETGTDPLDGTTVVEVGWDEADALRFPLCIAARVAGEGGALTLVTTAVARGNVVLADHGRVIGGERLPPPPRPSPEPPVHRPRPWQPRLSEGPLTVAAPLDLSPTAGSRAAGSPVPAAAMLDSDPRAALPAATVDGQGLRWSPKPDLLASDALAPDFTAETDEEGAAHLRFGDGTHGRAPSPGVTFTATYRVGNGRVGNVPADTITTIDPPDERVVAVTNPLPAAGGADPEPAELVRLLAPHAYRRQERAVTAADYAAAAERQPGVQRAVATLRWTGSWHTVFIAVDRTGGRAVTPEFEADLRGRLERYRGAGYDLEVTGPVPLPLFLALAVCVEPGFIAKDAERALLAALGSGTLPGGRRGFFHPDNLTFGQPVYLSQVYQAALAVPGVAGVEATAFHRSGRPPGREREEGVVRPGPLEIAQLANDPNFPEHGRLELSVAGGR